MTAVGYTDGDPRKVSVSGDTMTGALELPGDPTVGDEAATKHYVDTHGGGGGGVPSDSVVTETSYGQPADAGASDEYSRGDHTHGTPALPAIPDPAAAVVTEQAFGQGSAVGTSDDYARADHTHGTPPAPSVPTPANAIVTEVTYGQASAIGVNASEFAREDHTHGTPPLPTAAQVGADPAGSAAAAQTAAQTYADGVAAAAQAAAEAYADGVAAAAQAAAEVYADGVAAAAQAAAQAYTDTQVAGSRVRINASAIVTSGAINCVLGSPTQVGPDLTVTASPGDILMVAVRSLSFNVGGALYWNVATRVGGADANYFGNGTNSWPFPQGGISGWYTPDGEFAGPRAPAFYTVQAGDIVAGAVTVRIYGQPEGSDRLVQATAGQPFQSCLVNLRQAA